MNLYMLLLVAALLRVLSGYQRKTSDSTVTPDYIRFKITNTVGMRLEEVITPDQTLLMHSHGVWLVVANLKVLSAACLGRLGRQRMKAEKQHGKAMFHRGGISQDLSKIARRGQRNTGPGFYSGPCTLSASVWAALAASPQTALA